MFSGNKISATPLLVVIFASLSACGGGDTTNPQHIDPPPPVKVEPDLAFS